MLAVFADYLWWKKGFYSDWMRSLRWSFFFRKRMREIWSPSTSGEHCVPGTLAAWQVQRVDRWCGDGDGMVLWNDAQWPCGIARSSYGTRIGEPTVTTAMSHKHCHFLPKSIRMSGALGQDKARTLNDRFHGCMDGLSAQHYDTQIAAKQLWKPCIQNGIESCYNGRKLTWLKTAFL